MPTVREPTALYEPWPRIITAETPAPPSGYTGGLFAGGAVGDSIAYVWPLARPWLAAALSAVAGMALGVRVAARRGPLAPEQPPSHDRFFHETQTLSAELQALVNSFARVQRDA